MENDLGQAQEGQEKAAGTRISLPVEHMVRTKSASGGVSFHCGDAVAQALTGLTLAHVRTLATKALSIDVSKYDHLNPGQQRMTLGNLIRNMTRRDESLIVPFNEVLVEVSNAAREEAAAKAEADKVANEAKEKAKADAEALRVAKKNELAETKAKREADKKAKADERAAKKEAAAAKKEKDAADRKEKAEKKAADKQAKADAAAAEKQRKLAEKQAAAAGSEKQDDLPGVEHGVDESSESAE